MNAKNNKFGRFQCPCCNYYTFYQPPAGEYGICTVCWWEDDPFQLADPDFVTGTNHEISLNQAKRNFKEIGVSNPEMKHRSRKPNEQELPDKI
jgi:hypothetical protein